MLGELGAEPAAAGAAAQIDRNEVLGSTLPVASTLCMVNTDPSSSPENSVHNELIQYAVFQG